MDRRPLPLVLVGVLLAVVPAVALYSPADRGPVGVAVLVVQALALVVGLSVAGVGYYSARTGNPAPALWVAVALAWLAVLGVAGALVETRGGPLVPIPVWVVGVLAGLAVATLATRRYAPG
ncbi:hypothetical protein BRC83_04070 [Halobacteriales archaeon QS_1_68_17]|nr:MAG: hypothetical protein BRC83_04070 [Halobacteriales archaeon QS_1_68_17]